MHVISQQFIAAGRSNAPALSHRVSRNEISPSSAKRFSRFVRESGSDVDVGPKISRRRGQLRKDR